MTDKYSPAEIAAELGAEHSAGSLAATVSAFWPTIRAALLAHDKQTGGKKVAAIPSGD